ncbi:ATP-grasp domain-containing protein [Planosporangium sp. 12N6]|uniref:ATP-grasp domain-containing protein n=1 Tax=Planosporangium spinosum TaxID=3402278 RepID=UPI003CF686C1
MDAERDAIVVLGALFGARYPALVPAASARGLTVLGVDAPSPGKQRFDAARHRYPDHPLAGIAELAWTTGDRHDEILDRVLGWTAAGYAVRGVLAFGEDYVEAAALVADHLGLPSPGLRAGRVCRNKLLQRRYLAAWSPRSWLLAGPGRGDRARTWTEFPAVVKPTGREASSGVRRVDDRTGLLAALDGYDAGEPLLLEQLVAGHEVSVETLVQGGRVVFAAVTGKRTNETGGAFFVEMGHTTDDPSLDDATRGAVLGTNRAVLERLAFADGVAHAEYRITADGRVYLMEIAARAAGDSIVMLYHLATGAPMEEAMLAIALGEPASYPPPRRYVRQVYADHRPGVLRGARIDGLDTPLTWLVERWMWPPVTPCAPGDPATVHMVVVGRSRGDELVEIRQSGDRALMYVVDADTPAELDELEARCAAAVSLDVEPRDEPARMAAPVPVKAG